MATSTFDRPIVIRGRKAKRKLMVVLNSDKPVKPIAVPIYGDSERKRSEELLARYYFHSKP